MKQSTKNYKAANKQFLKNLVKEEGIHSLSKGVMYKVLTDGLGKVSPGLSDVVSVHYRGTLIDGTEFDTSLNGFQVAFRVREVIEGWQIALQHMHVGDKWIIYIPKDLGYGDKKTDNIPGGSTLIFEVELIAIN